MKIPFKIGEGEYRLEFEHRFPTEAEVMIAPNAARVTVAKILRREGTQEKPKEFVVASGIAICTHQDQFVKEIGRRIALDRMLHTWSISAPTHGDGEVRDDVRTELRRKIHAVYEGRKG